MSKVVGPGAQVNQPTDIKPLLEGASEYEYITILNPLSDDFQVRVAQDVPVNMPVELRSKTQMTQSAQDVIRTYGVDLKNPDHKAVRYIHNEAIIPAGKTMNFRGNEAQVVVKQLVNELLQREGKSRMLADPFTRQEAEQRIIRNRGSIQELMDDGFKSQNEQLSDAISQSNEVKDEPFPELKASGETTQGSPSPGADNPAPQKRSPGRPPKAATA